MNKNKLLGVLFVFCLIQTLLLPVRSQENEALELALDKNNISYSTQTSSRAKRKKGKGNNLCPSIASNASKLRKIYNLELEFPGVGPLGTYEMRINSVDTMVGVFRYSLVGLDTQFNTVLQDGVGSVNHDNFYFVVPVLAGNAGEVLASYYCNAVIAEVEVEGGLFTVGQCATVSRLAGSLIYVPANATLEIVN